MIDKRLIKMVAVVEGLRLSAYLCPAGKWTIGYGHTEGVREGDTCTRTEAEWYLICDLVKKAHDVALLLTYPLTDYQFAAVVSMAFNVRWEPFVTSTLLRKINAGDLIGAGAEFKRWNKAKVNGEYVPLPGLSKRRHIEAKLFLAGEFSA